MCVVHARIVYACIEMRETKKDEHGKKWGKAKEQGSEIYIYTYIHTYIYIYDIKVQGSERDGERKRESE